MILCSSGTQTLDVVADSQSEPIWQTDFNERNIITNGILQELVSSYHTLVSSSDFQVVDKEISRLMAVFDETRNNIIWFSLMSKLKQIDEQN